MHIFRDQQNETRFAAQLLRQISMMREQQRSISGILRLLSDRCQYTFLLVDEDGKDCGFAPWPMSINEEFRNSVYDHIDESDDFPVTFLWKDCNYVICKNSFATKMKSRFTLFSIMAAGTAEDTKLLQASEVLQSSYDIWDDDLRKKRRMILFVWFWSSPPRKYIGLQIQCVWISIRCVSCGSSALRRQKSIPMAVRTGIVDTFDNSVVAFMNDDKYLEFDKDLCESLTKYLQEQYPGMILTWCGALDSITDAKRAYLLLEEYFPTACAIYAHKTVLTQRELSFAGNCHDTLHKATVLPEKYRLILKPLQGRDEKTAIDTLSAYLIDADKNIAAAAKYLHVHESTVKYRLNNIKRKLGYDIAEMPGVYSLYKALALNRLLHTRNNIKY